MLSFTFMLRKLWSSTALIAFMNRLGFGPPIAMHKPLVSSSPHISSREKVLIITGPTAVGKSSIALNLCKRLNGEIISADSVQVFHHLNVGSNKASVEEQSDIPHHMLNIADPSTENFSAGQFFRASRSATEDVLRRGALPVTVGGTMMYVRWFIYGRPATPRAGDEVKAKVQQDLAALDNDWDSGIALLARHDPKRASALSKNDWYRLGRALEIVETTGTAMTEMPLQGGAPNTDVDVHSLDFDFRCIFLYGDRVELNRSIDLRCEEMILPIGNKELPADMEILFEKSILTEVASLLSTSKLRVTEASPARAIGYRQTIGYLVSRALVHCQASKTEQSDCEEEFGSATRAFRCFIDDFQAATRGYAKQQISWFRKEKRFRWVKAGVNAEQCIKDILDMSEEEYGKLQENSKEEQKMVKESMIAQGKLMKRYISQNKWLIKDSEAEKQAVFLGERCAAEMGQEITTEELERMRDVVAKRIREGKESCL